METPNVRTVRVGKAKVSEYQPVAETSKQAIEKFRRQSRAASAEANVTFRLNQTGNIFYATTSNGEVAEGTKELFDSVTVFFSALTKALASKNKSLTDYDAVTKIIRGSGFFVEVQKFETELKIKQSSVEVNTQIIQQLLPGVTSGDGLVIAKAALSALGEGFAHQSEDSHSTLCHLLFICEEIFGAPSVTVRVFYASKDSHTWVVKSGCGSVSHADFTQKQQADTFLFVSPEKIKQYTGQFVESRPEQDQLVETLSKMIA